MWAPARYRAGDLDISPVLDTEEKLDNYVNGVPRESDWAVIGGKKLRHGVMSHQLQKGK